MTRPLTFGSLFAGIEGFGLGLKRAGLVCKWQVENDSYALRVLAKNFPGVPKYRDVRFFLGSKRWRRVRAAWHVDLVCGGFPCQDISNAGRRAGIDGERSGLWSEFLRVIRLLRPPYALVENVAAILGRGAGRVLGDLAECGYDAEWDCLPAAAFGAVHIRNRLFLLAYPNGQQSPFGRNRQVGRLERSQGTQEAIRDRRNGNSWEHVHDAYRRRHGTPQETVFAGRGGIELSDWWASEPGVGRVADGVPDRLDRLRGLGNAVVPHKAEWIGRQLIRHCEALIGEAT